MVKGRTKGYCNVCYRIYKQNLLPKILCFCGCKELIPSLNVFGEPMKYKKGHSSKGSGNPMYNNGISNDKEYIIISKPDHPNKRINGFVPQHRLVMEQHIGRYLTKDEHIHHKDGNRKNNHISNLQIVSNSEHIKLEKAILRELRYKRICFLCGKMGKTIRWFKHLGDKWICRSCKHKRDGKS